MSKQAEDEKLQKMLSFRLDDEWAERFERVVRASKRSKTSILEECLEKVLPRLEKEYLGG